MKRKTMRIKICPSKPLLLSPTDSLPVNFLWWYFAKGYSQPWASLFQDINGFGDTFGSSWRPSVLYFSILIWKPDFTLKSSFGSQYGEPVESGIRDLSQRSIMTLEKMVDYSVGTVRNWPSEQFSFIGFSIIHSSYDFWETGFENREHLKYS